MTVADLIVAMALGYVIVRLIGEIELRIAIHIVIALFWALLLAHWAISYE